MKRSNLIPITRIYDIYPKYTYSDDVKKFMDEIVDIDRANVYTEDEVVAMFTDLMVDISDHIKPSNHTDSYDDGWSEGAEWCVDYIQEKINALRGRENGKDN